eukprot:m.420525 g.420525  ORF g.420525 m.420525 type:complete len:797 (-) comp20189_c0_seq14:457-2847(-)
MSMFTSPRTDDDMDDDAAVVLWNGWGTKQGKIFASKWKRRYFVLKSDGQLSYYKAAKHTKPVARFAIGGSTRVVKAAEAVGRQPKWPAQADPGRRVAIVTPKQTFFVFFGSQATTRDLVQSVSSLADRASDPLPEETAAPVQTEALAARSAVGIAPCVLRDLLRDYLDDPEDEALTTTDVCERVVKPRCRTAARMAGGITAPFANLLLREDLKASSPQSPQRVGPATVFVSHAWRYPFRVLVDTLLDHADKHSDTQVFFWIDLFANDQLSAVSRPFEWWTTTFRDSISAIGSVVAVLHPWHKPIPVERAWCLFELHTTLSSGTPLTLLLPPGEGQALVDAVRDDYESLVRAMADVSVSHAQASRESDRDMILRAIDETEMGRAGMDEQIKKQLREWCLQRAEASAIEAAERLDLEGVSVGQQSAEAKRASKTCNEVGNTLWQNGKAEEAMQLYKRGLAIDLKTLGENHPETATSLSNIGSAFYNQGDYDNAIQYHEQSLAIRKTLGEDPNLANSYDNLGSAYDSKGDYDKAIGFFNQALSIQLKTLGEDHHDTAITYTNLGLAHKNKEEYDKAIDYYEKGLAIKLKTLGENHPNTATSCNNLGLVHKLKGNHDAAISFYERGLAVQLKTLGENHANTAASHNNLAMVHFGKGDADKAIEHFGRMFTIQVKTLGEHHPALTTTYHNFALAFALKGDYGKVAESYERGLAIELRMLGEEHPVVATSYNNIAAALFKLGGDYTRQFPLSSCCCCAHAAVHTLAHQGIHPITDCLWHLLQATWPRPLLLWKERRKFSPKH